MLHLVHSSPIYNRQKLARTQMSLNRGMEIGNVMHLHKGILFRYLKKMNHEILSKMGGPENIILSEVAKPQKNTHCMHSLKNGY